ncbi:unnamed protein product [Boreogadus saida]
MLSLNKQPTETGQDWIVAMVWHMATPSSLEASALFRRMGGVYRMERRRSGEDVGVSTVMLLTSPQRGSSQWEEGNREGYSYRVPRRQEKPPEARREPLHYAHFSPAL